MNLLRFKILVTLLYEIEAIFGPPLQLEIYIKHLVKNASSPYKNKHLSENGILNYKTTFNYKSLECKNLTIISLQYNMLLIMNHLKQWNIANGTQGRSSQGPASKVAGTF